jgi:hypothetical protein
MLDYNIILPQPSMCATINFTTNICLFNMNNSRLPLASSTRNNGFNTIKHYVSISIKLDYYF